MSPMRSGRNTHGRGRARLAERARTPGAAGANGGGRAEPSPNGGNGVIRATTRRRHAANQLLMLQNPHRSRCDERQSNLVGSATAPAGMAAVPVGGGSSAPGHTDGATAGQNSPNKNRAGPLPVQNSPSTLLLTACAGQNSPNKNHAGPLPVQNSPSTLLLTACAGQNSPNKNHAGPLPVQNSPCSPKMAQFGAFCPRRANFLPMSPPTSHAGRTLYRIQAGYGNSKHNNTTDHTSVKVSRGSNE